MSAIPMTSTSNQSRLQENGHHYEKSSSSTHVIDDESNNQTKDQQGVTDSGIATDAKHTASGHRGAVVNSPYQSSSNGSRISSDDDTAERVPRSNTRDPSTSLNNMSLPSLSRSTQSLVIKHGTDNSKQSTDSHYETGNGDTHRSHSRERVGNTNNSADNRWSNKDDDSRGNGDDHGIGYPGGDDESPTSQNGPNGQEDLRIMFHGREIYADDLVGLRVAKTFVGHGRFLGQVVKFDDTTALYTIVYADGDAEELSIDNTIRILIQDEIERADPLLPPVTAATSLQHEHLMAMDSRDGNSTPVSSTTTSASAASNTPMAPPPGPQHRRPSANTLNISAREAQFVIGLFENHALPVLLRQGWRVQSNSSGSEQRYWAPPGNFRGAGQIFSSALDVVELIASDNDTLSLCFPSNVHSAILSLFPDIESTSAPRKRSSAESIDAEMAYDPKRVRSEREEVVYGSSGNIPGARGVGLGLARTGLAGRPTRESVEQRLVTPVSYRTESERDSYGANARTIPSIPPSDRLGSGSGSRNARGRSDHSRGVPPTLHEPEYRRLPGGIYHSSPLHSLAEPESGHGSRWSSAKQMEGESEYRSSYAERAGEWDERGARDPGYTNERAAGSRYPFHRSTSEYEYHSSAERSTYSRDGAGASQTSIGGVETPPQSYRYRAMRSNVPSNGPQASLFLHRHPSDHKSPTSSPSSEFQIGGGPPQPPSAERFSRPLSRANSNSSMLPSVRPGSGERCVPPIQGRGFSMMDVDRANGSRPSNYERMDTGRGRSPHTGEMNVQNIYSQFLGGSGSKRRGINGDSPDTLLSDVRPGSGNKTSNATDESRVI